MSSLPEQYKHFATAWESTSKCERTLTNLTSRLIAEEIRSKSNDLVTSVLFKTDQKKCFKYNKGFHKARFCSFDKKQNRLDNSSQFTNGQSVLNLVRLRPRLHFDDEL